MKKRKELFKLGLYQLLNTDLSYNANLISSIEQYNL